MTAKELRLTKLSCLQGWGVNVPALSTIRGKVSIGVQAGSSNLATVIFGMFACKYSPVPL